MVQKVSKMGPKWVQNGSKTGPKKGQKGVQKGVPKWVPQRSEPKKSRKIFFLWPQSTKKVTHVPVFEEKIKFLRKKLRKNRPTGGCSPPGGTAGGGCRARKKKVPEKISKKIIALIDL